jgi:hypothetical protein
MTLLLRHSAIFLVYLVVQLLVFNNLTLWEIASIHGFLVAILIIPVNTPFPLLLLAGFTAGMIVDIFSAGAFKGISAFSCVLILSIRNLWVGLITNKVSFRGNEENLIKAQPFVWIIQYILPLIVIFEITYHLLEAFSFEHIGLTLLKAATSSVYTFVLSFILIFWIHQDSKR